MILTGKAKEDFIEYYNNHSIKYLLSWTDFDDLPLVVKNALIIEWFDSVGIKTLHSYSLCGWYCELKDYNNKEFGNHKSFVVCKNSVNDFDTRQEATDEAIKKANEIYNKL